MASRLNNQSETALLCKPPRQPLSSYNLFFTLERKRILEGMTDPITREDARLISAQNKEKQKVKRPHRKTHGIISFRDLAKIISTRWKKLDATSRKILDDQAKQEKLIYLDELKEWKARQAAMEDQDPVNTNTSSAATDGLSRPVSPFSVCGSWSNPIVYETQSSVTSHLRLFPTTSSHRMATLESLRNRIREEMARLSSGEEKKEGFHHDCAHGLTLGSEGFHLCVPQLLQADGFVQPEVAVSSHLPEIDPVDIDDSALEWMSAKDMEELFE